MSESAARHNVDDAEIAHFSTLAEDWWDPTGPGRTLHEIHPCRVDWLVSRWAPGGQRVLDLGCGGGLLTESLARAGAVATGIDASAALIAVASGHATREGLAIDYHAVTAEAHAQQCPGRYSAITCMELLEHVPDPAALLAACHTLLAPHGELFLSTLNRTPVAFGAAIVAAEYVLRLVPRGTHQYRRFIRPSELARWLRAAGFEVLAIDGMAYNPLSRSARLTRDVSVNYLLHARRLG